MYTAAVMGVCVATESCVNLVSVPPATATRDLIVMEGAVSPATNRWSARLRGGCQRVRSRRQTQTDTHRERERGVAPAAIRGADSRARDGVRRGAAAAGLEAWGRVRAANTGTRSRSWVGSWREGGRGGARSAVRIAASASSQCGPHGTPHRQAGRQAGSKQAGSVTPPPAVARRRRPRTPARAAGTPPQSCALPLQNAAGLGNHWQPLDTLPLKSGPSSS